MAFNTLNTMDNDYDDPEFNPLYSYPTDESLNLSLPKSSIDSTSALSPISEEGNSEYEIVNGYSSTDSLLNDSIAGSKMCDLISDPLPPRVQSKIHRRSRVSEPNGNGIEVTLKEDCKPKNSEKNNMDQNIECGTDTNDPQNSLALSTETQENEHKKNMVQLILLIQRRTIFSLSQNKIAKMENMKIFKLLSTAMKI